MTLLQDSTDCIVRYYAVFAVALLTGMSDHEMTTLMENVFVNQDESLIQAKTEYMLDMDTLEKSRKYLLSPTGNTIITNLEHLDLTYTVDLCGVLVAHESIFDDMKTRESLSASTFVITASSGKVLADLALAMSCGLPVLLEGKSGVGKTSLIEEAGRLVGAKELLKIHLGDQTDCKLLVGTYMTTSTPGEFRWQPGVLTTAVIEGRWIVFEDIDMAPVEVLAVLLPLLETRWLHIPSRGERIRAKQGFKMFATRKTGSKDTTKMGSNLWATFQVPELSLSELELVLKKRFPSIHSYISGILSVFESAVSNFPATNGRQVSIRDLIKWCGRFSASSLSQLPVSDSLSSEMTELLFREAYDCFVAMVANEKDRGILAKQVGSAIGLSEHRVEYFLHHHVPTQSTTDSQLQYGRVTMPIRAFDSLNLDRSPFANTSASSRNLERISVSVKQQEPILLVGETGTGKTTIVQRLASQLGHKLTVMNMSQQSDSTDLLGGFKPVDALMLASPIMEMFDRLFNATFSSTQNQAFLNTISKLFKKKKWDQLVVGFKNACQMARQVSENQKQAKLDVADSPVEKSKKLRKVVDPSIFLEWETFSVMIKQFKAQTHQIKTNFLFSFVEGGLIKAIKKGEWILLDEINLANAETLECLSTLLQSASESILLLERGDTVPVHRHPDFRLFACMNPANDAGKRNLPSGLRSRFTEFWIDAPDSNISDLMLIIKSYISPFIPPGPSGESMCMDVASFYNQTKELSKSINLFDGADQKFHVSMRTLTRALACAGHIAPTYGIRRSLYEGCFMTFMTGLGLESFKSVNGLMYSYILNGIKRPTSFVNQIPQAPSANNTISFEEPFALVETYWLEKGNLTIPEDLDSTFVLTPSVLGNLRNLARACLSRRYPVLIQGPTSAGKTSIIEYLAKRTGHRFIRINNHEHTDLQEYLGGYVSNDNGSLVFQEGVLVEALRKGYWVVLDELNLAPSDVLEALNRLLDDNRELYLAEKQEVIKPHPHFMLFATQNPAGQYGGRKQLSRAFRNRFLELHFTDIPENELETILERRCLIAPSYAKKCVSVYKLLSKSRDASRIFDGKQSFITLRDLFRWALRRAESYEQLARDGYMLLAERVRRETDRLIIQEILQKELRVKLDAINMYESQFTSIFENLDPSLLQLTSSVVWTGAMKKLFVLIYNAAVHYEPVLLIGETGCGKTTVCQVLASIFGQRLHMVNAHQNSETSDFLGSQRPVRGREEIEKSFRASFQSFVLAENLPFENSCIDSPLSLMESALSKWKCDASLNVLNGITSLEVALQQSKALFEWHDGPLVQAMKEGDLFLLDEISLADDSVLERLNSVLEPSRQLTLVEKSGEDVAEIKANDSFRFFATMNPGGDYGKKELSPALRNRFTEIWVTSVISRRKDLLLIISNKLSAIGENAIALRWAEKILTFIDWLAGAVHKVAADIVSLRDVLAWCDFFSASYSHLGLQQAFLHGGYMVLVDGIGINPLLGSILANQSLTVEAKARLFQLSDALEDTTISLKIEIQEELQLFGSNPFYIPFGCISRKPVKFSMDAPTTLQNAMRVLRAMSFSKKPILLEGSPGAGKTSLVTSIAALGGYSLARINLSEQTDLMDLFGSDLPVEGGRGGEFAWRDGPFLKAMQEGEWVLLDELNLASQQVLEGLNACLDHRATVYIPELDRHFSCHPDFRVFAAQNPQSQGGGRKGLPKSFVNRFTLVCVDDLLLEDMRCICKSLYPNIDSNLLENMISFNQGMKLHTMELRSFGWQGSPWEFNLRDLLRWIELTVNSKFPSHPSEFLECLYLQRMRTKEDRERVKELFMAIFENSSSPKLTGVDIYPSCIAVGSCVQVRQNLRGRSIHSVPVTHLQLLPSTISILHACMLSVDSQSPVLIVGPAGSGKTSIIRFYASLLGQRLEEFSMNPGVDALELLGGFEQVDMTRKEQVIMELMQEVVESQQRRLFLENRLNQVGELSAQWIAFKKLSFTQSSILSMLDVLKAFADEKLLIELQEKLNEYITLLKSESRGKFEWLDSILVNAIQRGHWMLIDNVNLCSSSVLDRLNSLLETNGSLSVNERGLIDGEIKVIKPHPNFRLFMAMDPKHGEISRAMRNRAVEICISDPVMGGESCAVDILRLLTSAGIPGLEATKCAKEMLANEKMSSARLKLLIERVYRGESWKSVFGFQRKENWCGLTSWPDKISGNDWILTSCYSGSLNASSFLYHQLHESATFFIDGSYIPSAKNLKLASSKRYFKSFSIANRIEIEARTRFISAMSCGFPLKMIGDVYSKLNAATTNNPLLCEILNLRLKILSSVSLECYSDLLPFDLDYSNVFFNHLNMFSRFKSLLELWYIRKDIEFFKSRLDTLLEDSMVAHVSSLSIIQSSYWFSLRKLRLTSLSHPSVKFFYRFCEIAIKFLMEFYGEYEFGRHFIDLFDCFWNLVNEKDFEMIKILVIINRILKLVASNISACPQDLVDCLNEIATALDIPAFRSCSSLWKKSDVLTLSSFGLMELSQKFRELDKVMDFWSMTNPKCWFLKMDLGLRKMLIEGFSTLYFLNSQDQMDDNLFEAMKQLTMVFPVPNNDGLQESLSLQSIADAQMQADKFLFWPIIDLQCLTTGMQFMKLLCGTVKAEDVLQAREYLSSNSTNSSFSPLHFEPFQRIIWIAEAGKGQGSMINFKSAIREYVLYWFKGVWKNGFTFWSCNLFKDEVNSIFDGAFAPLLFNEVELPEDVHGNECAIPMISGTCSIMLWMTRLMDHVPIYCVSSKLSQLRSIQDHLSYPQKKISDIYKFDDAMLEVVIFRFLGCYCKELRVDHLQSLNSHSLPEVLALISDIPNFLFARVKSILQNLAHIHDGGVSVPSEKARGMLWVSFSCLLLRTLIPDFELDPVEVRTAKQYFLSQECDSLASKLLVDIEIQILAVGGDSIDLGNKSMHTFLESYREKELNLKFMLPIRPVVSQLSEMISELKNLKNQIMSDQKINELCVSISNQESNWIDQESSIQQTLAIIATRLEKKYPLYSDLIDPVVSGIFQLKYGLRLLSSGSSKHQNISVTSMITYLLDFQCCDVRSIKIVANLCNVISMDSLSKLKVYLALERKLAVLLVISSISYQKDLIDCSTELYFAIVQLWSDAEEERVSKEEAKQNLYHVKTHVIKTFEEEVEEEFFDLFPDYAAEFADLEYVQDFNNPEEQAQSNSTLSAELANDLTLNIASSFKEICTTSTYALGEKWSSAYQDCFNVVADLTRAKKYAIDRSLDEIGQLGFLYMSSLRINQIVSESSPSGYDFYNDSNISQVQQVRSLLMNFSQAVHKPLAKWPEHDVLLNLDCICMRILSFPATSPIIRFLTGIEILLVKSDDWEKYSSKEFSLKKGLDEMVSLIVKWRKLELESWRDLLDVESKKAKRKVASQWFHLFKIIIGTEEDRKDDFWKGVLDLLNQFCLSSTLGEFAERLIFLTSFKNFLQKSNDTVLTSSSIIIKLVWNVEQFFSQFSTAVSSKLDTLKQPILKELREYVQIASWKDVNVFALKESAKRTHHHLNKIVKKFRAVLAIPVKDVIAQYHEIAPISSKSQNLNLQSMVDRVFSNQFICNLQVDDSSSLLTGRLQQCEKLFRKTQNYTSHYVQSSTTFEASVTIDALGEEVVSRIASFQSQTFSTENEKSLKGQKMIRKKAWVDLLKHLAFVGLSPRSSQKYFEQQDVVYMNSLPVPNVSSLQCVHDSLPFCVDLIMNAEEYFFKNIARLELVRKLSSNHSLDISSLELEKAISFMDHLMHISIVHRQVISESASVYMPRLDSLLKQIEDFISSKPQSIEATDQPFVFQNCLDSLNSVYLCLIQTRMALSSSSVEIPTLCDRLIEFESICIDILKALRVIEKVYDVNSYMIYSSTVAEVTSKAIAFTIKLDSYLLAEVEVCPQLSLFFDGLLAVARKGIALMSSHPASSRDLIGIAEFDAQSACCLEKVLIAFQALQKPYMSGAAQDEADYNLLIDAHLLVSSFWGQRCFSELIEALECLFKLQSLSGKENQSHCQLVLRSIYPLLKQVSLLMQFRFVELVFVHKAVSKLAYILSNTFYTIIKDGFCVPDFSDDQEQEEGLDDNVDGMGIGEGDGKKDVSDEIENEDQVEGLQNDQERAPDPNSTVKDEENGIEMENDFDGTLEDVEPDEENADDSEKEEDSKEMDDQMGGLDDSADVVDEKMWGDDEEPPSNNGEDEKTEKNAPVENGGETETVAKTEDQQEDPSEKDKKDKKTEDAQNEDSARKDQEEEDQDPVEEESSKINEDQPEMYEDSHGVDVKQADDLGENDLDKDQDQQEDDDLPDDLDLDPGAVDQEDISPPDSDDGDQTDPQQEDESMPLDADDNEPEQEFDQEGLMKEVDNPEQEKENNQQDPENEEEGDQEAENQNQETAANGLNEEEPPLPEDSENAQALANQNDSNADQSTQPFGVEGKGDQAIQNQSKFLDQEGGSASAPDQKELQGGTDQPENSAKDSKGTPSAPSSSEPNPHRSVGNAMEKWLSRLRNISDRIEDSVPQDSAVLEEGDEREKDFEFVQEDDQDQGNAQALGVANEDQIQNLENGAAKDEDEDMIDNLPEEDDDMEVDGPDPSGKVAEVEKKESEPGDQNSGNAKMKTKPEELEKVKELEKDSVVKEEEEDEDLDQDMAEIGEATQFIRSRKDEESAPDSMLHLDESAPIVLADYDQLRQDLETRMAQWRLEGHHNSSANAELWRKYSNLTRDFSFYLCEQLRLILEPTLSTKLKGDYRTGKRLNMRKIIPYIASQYKKDKIWLRRTKPSKRTYQIMLAIDDSMSMSNSHSVQLAFESLTLIANALNQLEVGEIGVISFGSDVKLLHPFERAWSDEAGANVLSMFTFAQESTRVRLLMDQSIQILNRSRALQQNGDLWQLQIIISDGICEDHEYIKSRVRSAAEDQIAMVFIVLDTRTEKDSILNMTSVSYDMDPATGSPALVMSKYMDSFPFDFYVIVKNVEKLPEILGDTIRQFFQLFSQS